MAGSESTSSEPDVLCPECDYNLTGVAGERCPWCGWAIDLDVLVRAGADTTGRRVGVIVAAVAVGGGSLLAIALMLGKGRHLTVFDGLAVFGVVAAAVGHLWTAGLALASRRCWPIRNVIAEDITGWLGIISVMSGVAGAASFILPMWDSPRFVRGVTVISWFEFALAAVFFTLPAWTLLILRPIAFRERLRAADDSQSRERHASGSLKSEISNSPPSTAPFSVGFFGPHRRDQITQAWSESSRSTNAAIERMIDQTWEAELAISQAEGRPLHNGKLVRLVSFRQHAVGVHLTLAATTYREFLGTHVHNAATVAASGIEAFANALGVSAIVATTDGFLALGRRGKEVAHNGGFLHTFGGMVERAAHAKESGHHVCDELMRELCEELRLPPADVSSVQLLGLVKDSLLVQPELVFDVAVRLTRAELISRHAEAAHAAEHSGIEFFSDGPGVLLPAMQSRDAETRMTPVAQAALLLHGQSRWGATWYEQACALLYGQFPMSFTASERSGAK